MSTDAVRAATLVAAVSLLIAACGSSTNADYPGFSSVQEMVDAADVVVTGKVLSTQVEEVSAGRVTETDPNLNPQSGLGDSGDTNTVVVTVALVEVTEVIKGDVRPGERIEVSQPGRPGHVPVGTTLVMPGETEYAFVLNQHDGAPFDIVNPDQGLYRVGAGGTLTSVGGSTSLPVAHHTTDLDPGR